MSNARVFSMQALHGKVVFLFFRNTVFSGPKKVGTSVTISSFH